MYLRLYLTRLFIRRRDRKGTFWGVFVMAGNFLGVRAPGVYSIYGGELICLPRDADLNLSPRTPPLPPFATSAFHTYGHGFAARNGGEGGGG